MLRGGPSGGPRGLRFSLNRAAITGAIGLLVVGSAQAASSTGGRPLPGRWEARNGDLSVSFFVERRARGLVLSEPAWGCSAAERPDAGYGRGYVQPIHRGGRLGRRDLRTFFAGRLGVERAALRVDLAGYLSSPCSTGRRGRELRFRHTAARHVRSGVWRIIGPQPVASGQFAVRGGGAIIGFDGYTLTGAPFSPPTSAWEAPCLLIQNYFRGNPDLDDGQYLPSGRKRHLLDEKAIDGAARVYMRFTGETEASAVYVIGDLVPDPPNQPIPTSCIPAGGGFTAEFVLAAGRLG